LGRRQCLPKLRGRAAVDQRRGLHWQTVTPPHASGLTRVAATDAAHAWAVSDRAVYTLTDDGSWSEHTIDGHGLRDVTFVDSLHGWLIGADGQVLHSVDGGVSSSPQGTVTAEPNSVSFCDAKHGWAVGAASIQNTADGGQTWTRVGLVEGPAGNLAAVSTPDAEHWWAVSHDGSIYAATTERDTGNGGAAAPGGGSRSGSTSSSADGTGGAGPIGTDARPDTSTPWPGQA
jgi:photosystem II stability/assembly factor-like uncharacterized protein